jgi:hypothetical protein
VATTYGSSGEPTTFYTGDINGWYALSWESKIQHLPSGFNHRLDPTVRDQQFYEMIGNYNQFWAGWPADGNYGNYWQTPHFQHWTWEASTNQSGNWVHNTYRDAYVNMLP